MATKKVTKKKTARKAAKKPFNFETFLKHLRDISKEEENICFEALEDRRPKIEEIAQQVMKQELETFFMRLAALQPQPEAAQ